MADSHSRNPFSTITMMAALAVGAWYFFTHFEIQGLDHLSVNARSGNSTSGEYHLGPDTSFASALVADWPSTEVAATRVSTSLAAEPISAGPISAGPAAEPTLPSVNRNLRIATWALAGLSPDRIDTVASFDRIAAVIRGFDVIALQQIRLPQRDFLPLLVQRASGDGRRYDFLVGPPQSPTDEHLAFVFDTNRIVTDRTQMYSVADPDNRMTHDPLVAWFRAADADPAKAWTFSYVNVCIELAAAAQEAAELPRILEAVAHDGRGEDDCLLGGLLQADDAYLATVLAKPSLRPAIRNRTTDIFARYQTCNLFYSDSLTTEALGRGAVLDFLRRENLSISDAEKVSMYLPVYAEFSPREGG